MTDVETHSNKISPQDFIAALGPSAKASAATSGIPASFTLAEGALESGWGNSQLALDARNLFGVKADPAWHGAVLTMRTREFLHEQWTIVEARWRKYDDWLGCLRDHAAFLRGNERYRACFAGKPSGIEFARRVAEAGYATDPAYAQKIAEVIEAHQLATFDS